MRFANEGGFCISEQEILRPRGMEPLIAEDRVMTQETQEWLQDCGVSRVGDLHSVSLGGVSTWMDVNKTKAQLLQQCLDELPVEDPVTLRPFQQWSPSPDSYFS